VDSDGTFDSVEAAHDRHRDVLEITVHFAKYPYGRSFNVYSALLVMDGGGYPATTTHGAVGGLKFDWNLQLLRTALAPTWSVEIKGGWASESATGGEVVTFTNDRFELSPPE
jgi:hypothetical protein